MRHEERRLRYNDSTDNAYMGQLEQGKLWPDRVQHLYLRKRNQHDLLGKHIYTVCAEGHFGKFSTWHGIHRHTHTSRQLFCWYQRMWLFQHIIHTLTCLSRFPSLHTHVHRQTVRCTVCVCSILKVVTYPCVIISLGWKSHLGQQSWHFHSCGY